MKLFRRQSRDPHEALRGFSNGLETALLLVSGNGVVRSANEQARVLFGFHEIENRTILAVSLNHTIERLVMQTSRTGKAFAEEFTLRTTTDLTVIARTWPNPMVSGEVYLSLRDVTEVRRLERVRQDFVANVSHEIKTPLTTIRAMAEVLAEVEQDDQALREKYLRQIVGEVDRLTALVDDLLVLGRAESESVERKPCNLTAIVNDVVIQLTPTALMRGLDLEWEPEGTMMISANPAQITQVALNLIDNAIKYTLEGKVEVSVSRENGEAVLRVRDTGLGIPSEDLPRIFERFYRVDKSRSRSSGGTGLGLSIVKHLVESHGGTVTVESALNQGSEFTVSLVEFKGSSRVQ